MAGRGGKRTGAGRKQIERSGPKQRQRTIARVKPGSGLVFDPALRDSKGHLKKSVMSRLDEILNDEGRRRKTVKLIAMDHGGHADETDTQYILRKDAEAQQIDDEWWAIHAKDRPAFSEFLKRKGFIK